MITKIDICNTATFGNIPTTIDGLKKLNFFFGANGTGKTTVSKIIADSTLYPDCNIIWENGMAIARRVYNRDFVERNFNQHIPGVFTLGEQEANTLEKIATTQVDIVKLNEDIVHLSYTLHGNDGNGGTISELSDLESKYLERFFAQKQKHDVKFAGGLEGVRNNRERFKEKVLSEATNNTSDLLLLSELEASAATVFSDALVQVKSIAVIQPQKLLSLENVPILGKRIIGKEDVDIATMIKKLNNSDWVRQGLSYYEANGGTCPFCQQKTDEHFNKSLSEYFDETFEQDRSTIKALASDYSIESSKIKQQLQDILDLRSAFVDNEKLEAEKKHLDSIIAANIQRIDQKEKEASLVIELDSLHNVLNEIAAILVSANTKITEHNSIVSNITIEREKLKGQIWRFIVEELKNDIDDYNSQKNNLNTAISSLKMQLQVKENEKKAKTAILQELEKQDVSIQPTIDGINNLLSSFGFTSFKLDNGGDGKTYKLTRADGTDAKKTLSEGERNFVTFLYFYHLLKGSHEESGMTADKIVVFDDPVSSLDSDVLFVVSTLIRDMFDDVLDGNGTVKQIFVLTHNVYFHKEVTYNVKKNKSYWLIKKRGNESLVESCAENPIKTSYQLLWDEVCSPNRNIMTIQNTLRRILENYFKLLDGTPLNNLYKRFTGEAKIKCKTLCSWAHDGSHSVFDDVHYSPIDDSNVDSYLEIFKQIFDKCGNIEHYNMMMSSGSGLKTMEDTVNDQT